MIDFARFTDSCRRVLTNYWFSSADCQFIDYRQKIEMTAKHRSVNNVFWRIIAGRIGSGRGLDQIISYHIISYHKFIVPPLLREPRP